MPGDDPSGRYLRPGSVPRMTPYEEALIWH
jgi:hypothetical protein